MSSAEIELMSVTDAATALGVSPNRMTQMLRDGTLVAVKGPDGSRGVPALFLQDGLVVKSLPSVITLLRDVHYEDHEIVDWLLREDDSLPGTPIEALRANRGTEVKRRAQVAGF